jgi:hypothetical protein
MLDRRDMPFDICILTCFDNNTIYVFTKLCLMFCNFYNSTRISTNIGCFNCLFHDILLLLIDIFPIMEEKHAKCVGRVVPAPIF